MRASVLATAALLLVTAGCGDDPADPPDEFVIEMRDGNVFFPATQSIEAGTTVVWRNVDNVTHNTTATNPAGLWASENLAEGGEFQRTFNTTGTFNYTCTRHPGMNGAITVN